MTPLQPVDEDKGLTIWHPTTGIPTQPVVWDGQRCGKSPGAGGGGLWPRVGRYTGGDREVELSSLGEICDGDVIFEKNDISSIM